MTRRKAKGTNGRIRTKGGLRRKWRSRKERGQSRGGINRREFLTYSAGAGMLLGASPLLKGCGNGDDDGGGGGGGGGSMEHRTYIFDLSHFDTTAHDLILVAGKQREPLSKVDPQILADLRSRHPILDLVPDHRITHYIERDWPADRIQLSYVQRIAHSGADGDWAMALIFYHIPISALMHAHQRRQSMVSDLEAPVPVKWARYGLTAAMRAQLADPVGENTLKDTCDQATSLVSSHPELCSGEPNSAAHIQCNVIGTQPQTQVLADSIEDQGPATTTGGWATQVPLIDSTTGQPYRNSQGQIQYMAQWSEETSMFAGQSISPALTTVKGDTTLGSNVTDVDPEDIQNNDTMAPTNGSVWTLQDGMPSVDQSDTQAVLQESAFDFQVTNQSPDNGYSVKVLEVDEERKVTIQIKNWYVRHLGFYLRYLDGDGNPIPVSSIKDELDQSGNFPFSSLGLDGEYDVFVYLVSPQWVVFGMPVETTTVEYTFPMPEAAASVLILNGGLGSGSDPYPSTLDPGLIMTVVFELAVPSIFLALAAAPGFPSLQKSLQEADTIIWVLQLTVEFFQALFTDLTYDEPSEFEELAPEIGEKLLDQAAERLDELIAEAIAEGEAITAVEDSIPVIGLFLAAVSAIGLAAQISETSAQVAQSPRTYATLLTFTHDVVVTIKHDPNDPAGFPATATHFIVTATFDNGTPHTITQELPGTTVTDPQTVTFMAVPFGGMVTVNVGFYSDTGWLAGNGSIGPVENVATDEGPLQLEITITENLVPLEADTVYSHKEIIVLDSQGNHVWEANTTPPEIQTVQGQCESVNGQLCSLTGITVSTINAAVGYAWQSYNSAVMNCASGSASQLHQFANIAVTQDPQSGYLFPGCGFSGTTRIVYDLLGKMDYNFYLDPTGNKNLIRQIRLGVGSVDYDGPDSNKAWGRFRFASDAMLLHPAGRVISINSSVNKIEVLTLPPAAVPDADAPVSQVYSGMGIREGLLNGPTLAALTPDGTILILETRNNRIQAFDLGANPVPMFMEDAYYVPLVDQPTGYLDFAVEYTGYMYVLSYTGTTGSLQFRLDIYTPEGEFLARTNGFRAGKVAVNYWRDLFALNYQVLELPGGSLPNRTEPSVSHWIPSTPSVTG